MSGQTFVDLKGELKWRFGQRAKNPYQVEHDRLFDAIRNNKPHMEAENGAKSTMTAILGRLCTYTGKRITWEKALNSKVVLMPDDIGYEDGTWTGTPPNKPDENGAYPIAIPGNKKWFQRLV